MGLVGYSDSEGSDAESTPAPPKPAVTKTAKSSAQKLVDPTAPRKIKVDLPQVKPEIRQEEDRPAKRLRTGGGFGGFNSLLPAPKRTAEKKTGSESRVNLKTSAAAAFSREPVERESIPQEQDEHQDDRPQHQELESMPSAGSEQEQKPASEVKAVGNAMRFKPLSVASKKKPKQPIMPPVQQTEAQKTDVKLPAQTPAAPPPKPKVSLFSISQDEPTQVAHTPGDGYEPLMTDTTSDQSITPSADSYQPSQPAPSNSLDSIAQDLKLSAAERRALFGRNAKGNGPDINIAHFNMEAEYQKNEELRAAGETVEHRAVKAIAPGKHSLQQLVNAASTQREALADKWAEGKRNRGEAGDKYGWG